ncbi:hypothetical protein EDB19DRAFT_1909759 [Suillus lakei]|nr:hypothetical protein EDB19DRAFT_1909759 [Suillus lakei]
MTLGTTKLVTLSKVQYIVTKYLMWEGDAFISPWVNICQGMGISPPLSRNLQFFTGMLSMSHMELLNYNEFYDKFMSMLASPSGAWVTGQVVNTYPMAWWTQAFDTTNYNQFTGNLPNINEIREMVDSHFAQLPEGQLLVTLATYVDVRSTPVAQQLAAIHASVKQEGDHIIELLENKVFEAQLVMSSLLRMETALGQDVCATITATKRLVRYLKREDEFSYIQFPSNLPLFQSFEPPEPPVDQCFHWNQWILYHSPLPLNTSILHLTHLRYTSLHPLHALSASATPILQSLPFPALPLLFPYNYTLAMPPLLVIFALVSHPNLQSSTHF